MCDGCVVDLGSSWVHFVVPYLFLRARARACVLFLPGATYHPDLPPFPPRFRCVVRERVTVVPLPPSIVFAAVMMMLALVCVSYASTHRRKRDGVLCEAQAVKHNGLPRLLSRDRPHPLVGLCPRWSLVPSLCCLSQRMYIPPITFLPQPSPLRRNTLAWRVFPRTT